jgi:hypothetical protein
VFIDPRRAAYGLRALLFSLCAAAPASAATIAVPAGGDLQGALNTAQPGDVIELEAGATYTGNFKLPVKDGANWIVLRTGGNNPALPRPGMRIDRRQASMLAKIVSGNTAPALATTPGTHHWRIELIEFQATRNGQGDIIALGAGSTQKDLSQMPHSLVFDRVYVHGDPTVGQKRGIALNSGATQIINSYFEDFKSIGQDSQAIAGWNGAGPYLIENNYTSAAGENFILGGTDPSIPNLVSSDITVRRNVFTKPLTWRHEKWQVKNAFELKNARRVLIEGNVFENVWEEAQTGYAVVLTVRNQGGKAPWSVVEDVTFRYNIIRHAGGAINILGHDDLQPSQQTKRIRISHNLIYDIDKNTWGGHGDFIQMGAMPRDITIENNTVFHDGQALSVYGGKTPTGRAEIENVVFRNNALRHNAYGVKGAGTNPGNPTISRFMPNGTFANNVLAGGPAGQYPAGNFFPSVIDFEAQFVNPGAENFSLVPGSNFWLLSSEGQALGADLGTMQVLMGGGAGIAPPGGGEGEDPGLPISGRPPSVIESRQ